jgi:hypothetical protein
MVIDDLADSFDYQNKYAIIQYLREINEDRLFKQIIMTHNFDFFRTIESRFIPYSHCLMASKSGVGVVLDKATGIRNVFVRDWKKQFFDDPQKRIACIPFLRNLVEFTVGDKDEKFATLTALIHQRPNSDKITEDDLNKVYSEICGGTGSTPKNGNKAIVEIIKREADICYKSECRSLESKVVMSIAIRLDAESFMIGKINDVAWWTGIDDRQTEKLLRRFKKDFAKESAAIAVLDRVQLMTPENIHLNSFMYEPIVDMSGDHLRQLYEDIQKRLIVC